MSKVIEDAAQDFAEINDDKAANSAHSYSKYDIADAYQQGADFGYCLAENRIKKEYEEKLRWIPVEEKLPPLNEQVLLLYDTDEYCVGVMTNFGFYLQPFDPIEQNFGSIYLAGTVNAWRSFL